MLAGQLAPDTGTLTVAPGAHVGLLAQEDHWNPDRTPADVLGAWDPDQIRATGLLPDADLGRPMGPPFAARVRASLVIPRLCNPTSGRRASASMPEEGLEPPTRGL